ncbi:hypothetical protein [Thermoflexibacter ruber]|uniref:Uncharacterized protein n=1 Tax=Thermoflexibacter ruber TaxID=1003 RepID=A0A1I2DZX8_9BACT|nr:hypothetical protein [Thermoflexibacter ruber]SFE85873.1 hypothetical protein SAMN04488541_100888 [Thermoflexibacter ruber]
MKNVLFTAFYILTITSAYSQGAVKFNKEAFKKNLVGQHGITLQWISWDYRGTVKITQEDKVLKITGIQRSRENTTDSVSINGVLEVISDKEIQFTGKIITTVSYNNGGKPCEKEGTYTFRKTGNRRYWRLQEMKNCDGVVVDYVDLYF